MRNDGNPYEALGISTDGITINVSLDAPGDYVRISAMEKDQDGRFIETSYVTGRQLTMPMSAEFFLVYDERLASFEGSTCTVPVTITRGGKSTTTTIMLLKYDLLLGESRYYYVVSDGSGGEETSIRTKDSRSLAKVSTSLKIMPDGDPDNPSVAMLADVEFEINPVVEGDTLGAYYEKVRPVFDADGNFVRMDPLPQGMIRLIGRFWREGNSHPVLLQAGGVAVSIAVKKPKRLFQWSLVASDDRAEFKGGQVDYTTTKDVFGQLLNVDELIISLAGETGIPPQIVKAQMFQESRQDFHLNPAYRYEPWNDWSLQNNLPKNHPFRQQPFYITTQLPHGSGTGIPGGHTNLYPKGLNPEGYPTSILRICDYALSNWNRYWRISKNGMEIEIVGSSELTQTWRTEFRRWSFFNFIPGLNPAELAMLVVKRKVLSEYTQVAQTRKAASYGIVQMTYNTAVWQGYNNGKLVSESDPPEALNDNSILIPFYRDFTIRNLKRDWGEGDDVVVPGQAWPRGWEETWKSALARYNGPKYANHVTKRSRYFEPTK